MENLANTHFGTQALKLIQKHLTEKIPFMRSKPHYIPALKYHWLTKFYDPALSLTMPETKFKLALVKQASILPNEKLLDFGCGSLTLSLMAKAAQPLAIIYAVDIDKNILGIAEKKLKRAGEAIFLQQYDGKVLPYSSGQFDKTISSLVFHHLDFSQKKNALKEIFRVLKPGGELHVADWGKAKNQVMRLAFYTVQLLDGFETTEDNVNGLLPGYFKEAGFREIIETKTIQTIFGTLSLYKAIKPLT